MSQPSIKRIGILLFLILSVGLTAVYFIGKRDVSDTEPATEPPVAETPATPESTPSPPQPPATTAKPPDLQQLQQQAQQPPALTPEQLEDDEQTDEEQVAAAKAWLQSEDRQQRIDGAEQLGAYPTPEAETLLTQTLLNDADAEVRSTAAQSLGAFDELTPGAVEALLSSLEDQSEDVRVDSLSTLEDILSRFEEGSNKEKRMLATLKRKAATRSVPEDTRTAIKEILEDYAGDPAASAGQ